jgi:hypothetical protein
MSNADIAVGRAGIKLLYDVGMFKAPFPLASKSNQIVAPLLITSGLLTVEPDDRFFVTLTPFGRAFLGELLSAGVR